MTVSRLSSWRDYFLHSKDLDHLNIFLKHLHQASFPSTNFETIVDEISKSKDIGFLSPDSSGTNLQLLHHPAIIGGSWTNPMKTWVAVLSFDMDTKPGELLIELVKEIQGKSHSLHQLILGAQSHVNFGKLHNARADITIQNIIPIPNYLIQVFIGLPSTNPVSIAIAFLHAMTDYDMHLEDSLVAHP